MSGHQPAPRPYGPTAQCHRRCRGQWWQRDWFSFPLHNPRGNAECPNCRESPRQIRSGECCRRGWWYQSARVPPAWPAPNNHFSFFSIYAVLAIGAVEGEGRHIDLEGFAVLVFHVIASHHESVGRGKRAARGILEILAELEGWLVT